MHWFLLWLSSLKHGILSLLLLTGFLHSFKLFLFELLLSLPRRHLHLLLLIQLGLRIILGLCVRLHSRFLGADTLAGVGSSAQVLGVRHQFWRKSTFLSLPFEFVVFFRFVGFVNLTLSLFVKDIVMRFLLLLKWIISLRSCTHGCFLSGNSIKVDRADTSSHEIFIIHVYLCPWMLRNYFAFRQLSVRFKCVLLLEFFFLSSLGNLFFFVLHQVTLVHEEVCRVHDLLCLHLILFNTHLFRNLFLSFLGKIR